MDNPLIKNSYYRAIRVSVIFLKIGITFGSQSLGRVIRESNIIFLSFEYGLILCILTIYTLSIVFGSMTIIQILNLIFTHVSSV